MKNIMSVATVSYNGYRVRRIRNKTMDLIISKKDPAAKTDTFQISLSESLLAKMPSITKITNCGHMHIVLSTTNGFGTSVISCSMASRKSRNWSDVS
jgi:hypothetical protein